MYVCKIPIACHFIIFNMAPLNTIKILGKHSNCLSVSECIYCACNFCSQFVSLSGCQLAN